MACDVSAYNSMSEGDPRKTYNRLCDVIRRYIERQTEDKVIAEKERAVKKVANISPGLKPTVPAPKGKAMPVDPNPKKKAKPEEEAASAKPRPNIKKHPEDKNKKGKGKGEGKDTPRGRSTSVDKKKTPCKLFAKGECAKGKDCPYRHKKPRSQSRDDKSPS